MSTERRITFFERVLLRLGHVADLEARAYGSVVLDWLWLRKTMQL